MLLKCTPLMPLVWRTLARYFHLDDREQRRVWHALLASTWSVPSEWRRSIELFETKPPWQQTPDAVQAFLVVTTSPQTLLTVLEALGSEGCLARAELRAIEEKVLARVNAHGQWY